MLQSFFLIFFLEGSIGFSAVLFCVFLLTSGFGTGRKLLLEVLK